MKKVGKQSESSADKENKAQPVELFDLMFASLTLGQSVISMSKSKDHGNATFSSRRVVGGDNLSVLKSSASPVSEMDFSSIESTWGWCCPGGEVSFGSCNGEGVFSEEIFSLEPTNFYGSEWIVNLNAGRGVNNFGMHYENPEDDASSEGVYQGPNRVFGSARVVETPDGKKSHHNDYCEVSPVTSGAVNVVVRHDFQTISGKLQAIELLAIKKGI